VRGDRALGRVVGGKFSDNVGGGQIQEIRSLCTFVVLTLYFINHKGHEGTQRFLGIWDWQLDWLLDKDEPESNETRLVLRSDRDVLAGYGRG
jgi:hypothetical protein